MYVRRVDGEELTFGFTGVLWRENVVFYDRPTESWWAQALGKAIRGELEGKTLEMYPSSLMTWRQWHTLHPDTLVMSVPPMGDLDRIRASRRRYQENMVIGASGKTSFEQDEIGPKATVLSFRIDGRPFAILTQDANRAQALGVWADGSALIAVATPDATTAKVFLSGNHSFSYVRDDGGRKILRDEATGSEWDGFEGRSVSGPLSGTRLEEVPSFVSYWFAWKAFFPDSTVLGRPR